ncbi:nucleotidyl transferase AbiEii/AbiGii toxin family protein [Bradyrhizobium sp. UFLA05-153]
MISVERLENLSADLSFEAATIERVVRLIDVLDRLTKDKEIGNLFALKGGTALNLFYLGLDRLSVDIDLNYIGAEDRKTMLSHKKLIEQRLPRLMQTYGYQLIRDPRSEHAGEKWRFRYTSAYHRPGTIEIDVNYMYRIPFFGTVDRDSSALGGYVARNIRLVDLHEIAAGKIVAMAARSASRDLYDAWRLLHADGLDWQKIKLATLAIGAATRDLDWREASLAHYKYDINELRGKLLTVVKNDMFHGDGNPEAWCKRILGECQEQLAPMFDHDEREMAFLDALYENGRVDVDGLTADAATKRAIESFPALQWKALNIRNYKRGLTSLSR